MNPRIISISLSLAALSAFYISSQAAVEISGSSRKVISTEPDRASGLNELLTFYGSEPVDAVYMSSGGNTPKWYRYSSLGGGYAEEISGIEYDGARSTLKGAEGDMGYIIEDGDSRYYFWLVNYSQHLMTLNGVEVDNESSDCDRTVLKADGTADEIHYFGINGRRFTLDRDITVGYYNLNWSDDSGNFIQEPQTKNVESLAHQIVIMPPAYCSTTFTVSGDRFLREWGEELTATSLNYQPIAVNCSTKATQQQSDDENSNQIKTGGDGLGGSAPAEISFEAFVTDAVIHTEWQMSRDMQFSNIDYRLSGQDLNFTFRDEGTVYVRFVGSNADGSCETYGETYTVNIGASELKCPNAFSPGASEGVNDEWKVSYRSIVDFECWIFDRYGTQLYHFSDPSGGWDGKYHGKLVSPGVYYYVIRAKGADGKTYKESGDINILRFKGRKGTGGGGGGSSTE